MRFVLLGVLATLVAAGAAAADPRPSSYTLPGNTVFPEGVAFQPATGNFFVSSTGDGTIFRAHVSEPTASVFLAGGGDGRMVAVGLEVDGSRLYAADGGPLLGGRCRVYVYDTGTRALLVRLATEPLNCFLNDVATTKTGDAFVTDSFRPVLWRIPANLGSIERWLDLTKTPFQYQDGFNANGIVATDDGTFLVVSQSNARKLFRIDLQTRQVLQITTDEPVGGDGLVLQGRTLYAVENNQIVKVELSDDLTSGIVVSRTSDSSFNSPTTNAIARGRMLVVNSQFGARFSGQPPVLPFTVSSIAIP